MLIALGILGTCHLAATPPSSGEPGVELGLELGLGELESRCLLAHRLGLIRFRNSLVKATRRRRCATALVGVGIATTFENIQTYVVDSFTAHAASGQDTDYLSDRHWLYYVLTRFVSLRTALAAVAFLRSLAGFGFPLFAPAMYSALGYGKGVTILAIAYCCGMAGVRVNHRVTCLI
jgi:hypothetical protein